MTNTARLNNVKNRLELYDKLEKIENLFLTKQDFETETPLDKPFRPFEHKYRHFLALKFYLLITCFDILGSTKEFMSFNNWINSKKHTKKFLTTYVPTGDILKDTKALLKHYNTIYGSASSFLNFINGILSEDCRNRLFASVRIDQRSNSTSPPRNVKDITSEKKISEFLIMTRNQFTHEGRSLTSGDDFFFKRIGPIFDSGGKRLHSWDLQHLEKKGSKYIAYKTRNWPEELREILELTVRRLETTQ